MTVRLLFIGNFGRIYRIY